MLQVSWTGELLQLCGDGFADSAETFDASDFAALHGHVTTEGFGAFSDDHDRIWLAFLEAIFEVQSDILDGIGDFRDEDRIRSTGQTSMQSNPACVSTHDFYHHDAAMRQRGAVQSIDTLGGKTYGGVEAKRECGGFKIVVNGLGHSHNAETFFVQ